MSDASPRHPAERRGIRRRARPLAVAALAVAVLATAACGGEDEPAASSSAPATPATTATGTADTGTSVATPTTAPAATAPSAGDVAAGERVFSQTCAGCHAGGGTKAGIGPRLAGAGLTPARIASILENGQNQMPAGLVEGRELADVVAYVSSLQ